MTTTTPPASPSTTTSMSNSTSLQTSPDKRKQEDSYYSSVTSFGSNMSGNMIRVHTLDDDNSESESDSEVPSRTDNRTPTQKDFIDGSDLDLGLSFMRKDSDRPLRNGSPLNDRPMSLPPSSPTHGVETNNERRLSLYDNIDVYYNAHYEQSMEESLEMIATPTGPAPVQIDMELPLFGPPIPIPDGGHVPMEASGESTESLEPPGPPPPLQMSTKVANFPVSNTDSPERPRKLEGISSVTTATLSDTDNVTNGNPEDALKSKSPDPLAPAPAPAPTTTTAVVEEGPKPGPGPVSPKPSFKGDKPPNVKPKPPPPAVKPKPKSPKSPKSPVNGVPHFKTTATLV